MSAEISKYDRQIRLWGVDGQKEIESSVVCALGSDETLSEILKTLCLHAIGHIIIVDDAKVTERDLHNNFLTERNKIGSNRADVVKRLLNEINPDPEIRTIIHDPHDISILDLPEFTSSTFVISDGNCGTSFINDLSDKVRSRGMTQLHIQTSGFYGAFYLDGGMFCALEGGIDGPLLNDFRLTNPFPELKEYLESYDVPNMDSEDLAKLPFLVPLYWARQEYLKRTGAKTIPQNKNMELENILYELKSRSNTVLDAVEFKRYGCEPFSYLSYNMETCFEICDQFPENNQFWRVVRAARDMYRDQGVPPHIGEIPDIECDTYEYKKLKEIYRRKGEEDANYLINKLPDIDPEYILKYAKSSWRAIGMMFKPLRETISMPNSDVVYDEKTKSAKIVQSLFIASRIFFDKHQRDPKEGDEKELIELTKKCGGNEEGLDGFVYDFCKFAGKSLPSVNATISALAAQEITKIIIKKETPINGILIYDGFHQFINTFP